MHPSLLDIRPAVAGALRDGRPVVALESTLIAHGLPWPDNLDTARRAENAARDAGAVPATIAVLDGRPTVGLYEEEIEHLARGRSVRKASSRDLASAIVQKATAATTVAATMLLAHTAGIRVFATGGIGGVHRGAGETWDVSADLLELSRTPVAVVCAGVKSILDVGATLERLETLGIPVAGYRTTAFPGFYVADSGHRVGHVLDSPEQAAAAWAAGRALGMDAALLVANPVPVAEQLPPDEHDAVLDRAVAALGERGIGGPDATPFLLDYIRTATGGASLEVNVAVYRNNVDLGARIAAAVAAL